MHFQKHFVNDNTHKQMPEKVLYNCKCYKRNLHAEHGKKVAIKCKTFCPTHQMTAAAAW